MFMLLYFQQSLNRCQYDKSMFMLLCNYRTDIWLQPSKRSHHKLSAVPGAPIYAMAGTLTRQLAPPATRILIKPVTPTTGTRATRILINRRYTTTGTRAIKKHSYQQALQHNCHPGQLAHPIRYTTTYQQALQHHNRHPHTHQ